LTHKSRGAAAVLMLIMVQLALAVAVAPAASAFDPGLVAATANDPAFDINKSADFRLALSQLRPCGWENCTATQSDKVVVSINGSERLTGTFAERYQINVGGVPEFSQNYTTIAVVLNGTTTGVVLQTDASGERTGDIAYTKNLNGSSTMNITLLPSNTTGNFTMYVFGYVGEGNRSTHGAHEFYNLATKPIQMRPQRLVPINVTLTNEANVSVTSVLVSFYAKAPGASTYTLIGNSTVAALNAKGTADVGVKWDATWEEPKVYTVKVIVDPLGEHTETFEDNNVMFVEVNLGPSADAASESVVGQAFLWGTLITVVALAAFLWWYNKVYE
jgi:hypothetical protein